MTKAISPSLAIPFKLPLKAGAPVKPCSENFMFQVLVDAGNTLVLPTPDGGGIYHYNYKVDYGDNTPIVTCVTWNDANASHTYTTAGVKTVTITGLCEGIDANVSVSFCNFLINVVQWGLTGFKIMSLKSCSNLLFIPTDLLGSFALITDFTFCFANCIKLQLIPSGLFDYAINVITFSYTFSDCKVITAIPAGLFDNNTLVTTFEGTFYDCYLLSAIPAGLFDNNTLVTNFESTFCDCQVITAIPAGLFDNNTLVTNFSSTFCDCYLLLSAIPAGLFNNNTLVTNFSYTFSSCNIGMESICNGGENGRECTAVWRGVL